MILPFTLLLLLTIVVACIIVAQKIPLDDTDDVENNKRSGLTVYTDHGTGYQYIKGGTFGGITPRLTFGGKHMNVNHDY